MSKVKFGVFADLHVDIMHDTKKRLEQFLGACREADVDFIIHLGDFCYPDENKKVLCDEDKIPVNISNALYGKNYTNKAEIIRMYNDFEKDSYHVLGNHDCDMTSKKETLEFIEAKDGSYYSFDKGGFHFIVLDTNYMKMPDGSYVAYENSNYFIASTNKEILRENISSEQIEWLKEDLNSAKYPSVIFSHATFSLLPHPEGAVKNSREVREIFKSAPNGVLACFNGHHHVDISEKEDDIWYVMINSISNIWLDGAFMCKNRYGEEIDEKYPNIKYTAPYRDAVFAIVTIDESGIDIKGRESEFVGPSPEELGLYNEDSWWADSFGIGRYYATASQKDRYLPFK